MVLFKRILLKEWNALLTLIYIFDKIGLRERSSENGIPR